MTVSPQISSVQFAGDGVSRLFPAAFPFFSPSDLVVQLVTLATGVTQTPVLNGGGLYDYTVLGSPSPGSGEWPAGTVAMNSAPPAGMEITVARQVPITQNTVLTDNTLFPAKAVEGAMDRLTMISQQLQAGLARAIVAPPAELNPALTLPPAAIRAGQLAGFDSAGNLILAQPTGTLVSSVMQPFVEADSFLLAKLLLLGTYGLNVLDYGATGGGVVDDTAAIQAAINAAGVGGTVRLPPGNYLLSATLQGLADQQILGAGKLNSILLRATHYGDTISFAVAYGARVSRLWFSHGPAYVAGASTLGDGRITDGSAHVRMINANFANITDCVFNRMPYQVYWDNANNSAIERNSFNAGIWDQGNVNLQEGIACICLNNVTGGNGILKIKDNYINGTKSAPRNVTYTDSASHSVTVVRNDSIGSRSGLLVMQCEDLLVEGNFFGTHSAASLQTSFDGGSEGNLDWRIVDNFFDDPPSGYGTASIYFATGPGGVQDNGVVIANNVFNGETLGSSAIVIYNAISPPSSIVTNFLISGNTIQGYVQTPIILFSSRAGEISQNTITGINVLNVSLTDDNYINGVLLVQASNTAVHDNLVGGTINQAYVGGNCYGGIKDASSTQGQNAIYDNIYMGCGAGALQVGLAERPPTIITAAGNYQATTFDLMCVAKKTDAVAWSFGLPLNPPPGRTITLKDGVQLMATYNCQVVGTVDGVTNPVLNTNGAARTWRFNGSEWNLLASA